MVWNFGGEMVYLMRRVGGDVFLMMCGCRWGGAGYGWRYDR